MHRFVALIIAIMCLFSIPGGSSSVLGAEEVGHPLDTIRVDESLRPTDRALEPVVVLYMDRSHYMIDFDSLSIRDLNTIQFAYDETVERWNGEIFHISQNYYFREDGGLACGQRTDSGEPCFGKTVNEGQGLTGRTGLLDNEFGYRLTAYDEALFVELANDRIISTLKTGRVANPFIPILGKDYVIVARENAGHTYEFFDYKREKVLADFDAGISVQAYDFTPSNNVVILYVCNVAQFWDISTSSPKVIKEGEGHLNYTLSYDHSLMAEWDRNDLLIKDFRSDRVYRKIKVCQHSVNSYTGSMYFSPDNKYLALVQSCRDEGLGDLQIIDLDSGDVVLEKRSTASQDRRSRMHLMYPNQETLDLLID